MGKDPTSKDDFNASTLQAVIQLWRDAKRLAIDPTLSPELREVHRQEAEKLHAEMEELGHKHGRASRRS